MQRGLEDHRTASALLVDLYEFTIGQAYYAAGMHEGEATFSLFTRHLPDGWGYLVAAGLDDVLAFLEAFAFREEDLAYSETTRLLTTGLLDQLRRLGFHRGGEGAAGGNALPRRACPRGQRSRPRGATRRDTHPEPSPLPVARRSEGRPVRGRRTRPHARRFQPAPDARHGRGAEGGPLLVSRRLRLDEQRARRGALRIPIAGTMAHSFVECFDEELEAFRAFARAYPENAILLVDTYDTAADMRRAVVVAGELARRGLRLRGVRLDSGDLLELAREARSILDAGGCAETTVFASGGLDEREIDSVLDAGAPLDGFGVGSKLGTSGDAPYLDMAYKLVSFEGKPRLKLSAKKATLPGRKQVWRCPIDGSFAFDVLGLDDEDGLEDGEPLLEVVMAGGRRVQDEPLSVARARAAEQRARLALVHRGLSAAPYEVRMTSVLIELQGTLASEIRRRDGIE